MASIRKTKKEIRYACGDIASELLIAAHAIKGFDMAEARLIIGEIASMQVDALNKCSFAFDRTRADFENDKAYREARRKYVAAAFHKLNKEVTEKTQAIIDRMNAAMPQHIKDAAKK